MDCVFCQIAAGALPARVVHETRDLICFFPRRPNLLGHTLITSKAHFEHIGDCNPALGTSIFTAAQRLSSHYAKALGATGFNLLNASGTDADQSVPHLHVHYFPRTPNDDLNTWPDLPRFQTDLDELLERLKVPAQG